MNNSGYLFDIDRYYIPEITDLEISMKENVQNSKLIVLTDKSYELEENKMLLEGILKAINFDPANTSIIELDEKKRIHLSHLPSFKNSKYLLVMGLKAKTISLNLDDSYYRVRKIYDQSILFSHSLDTLRNNTEYKKLLWTSLRSIFQDKQS